MYFLQKIYFFLIPLLRCRRLLLCLTFGILNCIRIIIALTIHHMDMVETIPNGPEPRSSAAER